MAIMTDVQFRAVLDWWMVSDPWPLDEKAHEAIGDLLAAECAARDIEDWVVAYHQFDPNGTPFDVCADCGCFRDRHDDEAHTFRKGR